MNVLRFIALAVLALPSRQITHLPVYIERPTVRWDYRFTRCLQGPGRTTFGSWLPMTFVQFAAGKWRISHYSVYGQVDEFGGCWIVDFDADGDVDLVDVAIFQAQARFDPRPLIGPRASRP